MTDHSLPPPRPTCGDIAADLRRIADAFDLIEAVELEAKPYVEVSMQPGGSDDLVIARTDAIARALFGTTGAVQQMSDGVWHYKAAGRYGVIGVDVYDRISDPGQRERDAELERLRAEVAELRGEKGQSNG